MAGHVLFENVWKRFQLGPAHDSLRDLIPAFAGSLLGRKKESQGLQGGDFWAVKDVSFEVKPGEALGIIGGNGAGKSTTLKLLTKILRPTRGHGMVEGRVGSLIEVSAGFHQDLSGRENVFLQGAIMGMPQKLIRERFDSIVDFSGISEFIDTPVKRYSSGMNARLGFSIAVHLEPDVLIIDEVLSVGDVEFQQRAFDRIKGLVKSDIPVVIVSHQLDRVIELCTKGILLTQGAVTAEGRPAEVVQRYLGSYGTSLDGSTSVVGGLQITGLECSATHPVKSGEAIHLTVRGNLAQALPEYIDVVIAVRNAASNAHVYGLGLRQANAKMTPGELAIPLTFNANVAAGTYRIETAIWDQSRGVSNDGPAAFFEVLADPPFAGSVQLALRTS